MQGKRVTLRALEQSDSDLYYQWINNKELVLYNSNFKPVSKEEHNNWFNNVKHNKNIKVFSIVENKGSQLIGSCSLRNINHEHKNAELQIRIGDFSYHGRGYGSEAVRLLVRYGFNTLNLKRIYLYVFCHNHQAIRAYKKCDFLTEGVLKKSACIQGEFIDLQLMAIVNNNF